MKATTQFDARTAKFQYALAASLVVLAPAAAQAAVTISNGPTKNMTCSAGVCTPTHKSAVLNASDLQSMLATGNVLVTTGSGSLATETSDIDVNAPLSWSSTAALTLDAYHSITFSKVTLVAGAGGLSFITNDGGTGGLLSFGTTGRAIFSNLSGTLTINGAAYTLVVDLATLASDIAANPSGNYALAANYDAGGDGTYASSPIPTTFNGSLEGLGNTIKNLTIDDTSNGSSVGLFADIGSSGEVRSLGLVNVYVRGKGHGYIGGVAGQSQGTLWGDYTTGRVFGGPSETGGLVGFTEGTVDLSHSTAAVQCSGTLCQPGGLAGNNTGTVETSYATGTVTLSEGSGGGLIGANSGALVSNCYATGAVLGTRFTPNIGGLVGVNYLSISTSYSTGNVSGPPGSSIGGLVGADDSPSNSIADAYWDTTTSGVTNPGEGAGNRSNDPGITGLTTSQLQSGLPTGFDASVWGQSPSAVYARPIASASQNSSNSE